MSFVAGAERPLGGPSDLAATLLLLALVAFFLVDRIAVRYATGRRTRARSDADRSTYVIIQVAQIGALAVAATAPRWATGLNVHTGAAALAAVARSSVTTTGSTWRPGSDSSPGSTDRVSRRPTSA
jgi:hypothetical protein